MQAVNSLPNRVQSGCHIAGEKIKAIAASEKWYTVATATSTVAMGVFLFSSPFTTLFVAGSTLASGALISITAQKFGHSSTQFNRAWMIAALLVSSSALAVFATYGIVVTSWGITAVKTLELSTALHFGTYGTAMMGVAGEAALNLYKAGVNLYREPKWEAMENFINSEISKKPLTIRQRLLFSVVMIDPQTMLRVSSTPIVSRLLGSNLYDLSFACLSDEMKENSFSAQLQNLKMVGLYVDQEQRIISFKEITRLYEKFSKETQKKHLDEIYRLILDFDLDLTDTIEKLLDEKVESLNNELDEKVESFIERFNDLKGNVKRLGSEQEIDEDSLGKSSKELQTLRNEIVKYTNDLTLYFDENIKQSEAFQFLTNTTKELTDGESDTLKTITRLNSQVASRAQEEIDRDDATWNYFLTDSTGKAATKNWIATLQDEFGVQSPNDLDTEMEKIGISPLGALIDNVLKGDTAQLQNKEELWELIKAHKEALQSRPVPQDSGIKGRIYSILANTAVNSTSKTVRISSKVTYRAIMILSTVTPIIIFPKLAAFGATTGIVYYGFNSLNKRISQSTFGRRIYLEHGWILDLAGRRPLLTLLTSGLAPEFSNFNSANIFGKLRIISWELMCGCAVTEFTAPYDYNDDTRGLGGIVQGFSLGREIVELSKQSYNYLKATYRNRQQHMVEATA